MSYLFKPDVVFFNAFYAVQDTTNFLDNSDINQFCGILEAHLKTLIAEEQSANENCCNLIFDFTGVDLYLDTPDYPFSRLDKWIVYNRAEAIKPSEVRIVNLCFNDINVCVALAQARSDFKSLIDAKLTQKNASSDYEKVPF